MNTDSGKSVKSVHDKTGMSVHAKTRTGVHDGPESLFTMLRNMQHRGNPEGLIHHSDRGSQYLSIRYTERLAEAGIQASVGSVGDSYDNALAETINGLFKTEIIRRNGPWKNVDAVEYATLEWVNWFNNQRLLSSIGYISPAQYETDYYDNLNESGKVA